MSNTVVPLVNPGSTEIEQARCRWQAASDQASAIARAMFQPGSGYGCPEAEQQDRHRLETACSDAERLFREYQDLERRYTQHQMLYLQRSQQLATWASFSVAAAVGLATIVGIIAQFAK
jgi:hypothetical protein